MSRPIYRRISRRTAQSCEQAETPRCRCRCGGLLHGAARGEVTDLPVDDPHSPSNGCERCGGTGVIGGLFEEPCPECKGGKPRRRRRR